MVKHRYIPCLVVASASWCRIWVCCSRPNRVGSRVRGAISLPSGCLQGEPTRRTQSSFGELRKVDADRFVCAVQMHFFMSTHPTEPAALRRVIERDLEEVRSAKRRSYGDGHLWRGPAIAVGKAQIGGLICGRKPVLVASLVLRIERHSSDGWS
jgi:hypothetical protein